MSSRLTGALALVLALAASRLSAPLSAALSDDPGARLLRVERWLKAAFSHQPGADDDAVIEVSLWSDAELRTLYADQAGLAQLAKDSSRRSVKLPAFPGRRPPPEYTDWQRTRLHVLACAASGQLNDRLCAALGAERQLDPTLKRLASAAGAAAARGEPDFIIKRGALLHGDIAMIGPPPVLAPDTSGELGKIRIEVNDGESRGYNPATVHWEMARQLFDYVRKEDPLVRQWYVATASWMQDREQHDTDHLTHARAMFPDAADVFFLSGTQQETYAGPAIQAIVRTAVLPQGYHVAVAKESEALRDAEEYFRHSIAHDPARAEARIRLGHVLLARGRPQEAATELAAVDAGGQSELLQYFHAMFTGAAEEGLSHFDRAREAYARASSLFPAAQSPYLALSALATHRGDRAAALKEVQPLFDLPVILRQPADPWWLYHVSQARDADMLMDRMYAPFAEAGR